MSNVILEKVSRNFGEIVAVSGIDLRVNEGEFVTLLGPSGCGKTTTLRMVAGPEQNTGGRISIGNEVVSDAARGVFVPSERRRLGMVFQSYAVWPHMTVFENVAYPLRVRRRPAAEIKDLVLRALRLVEMERFAQRLAPALSGGQQQRVAIARALVFEPKVLLLDEPLSNLDAKLRLQMGDEFRSIQRRLGMTSLYVTHDQSEAMALSDRVVVMDQGRIQQIGSPEEIYRYPANRTVAAFFGTPNLLEANVETCAPGPTPRAARGRRTGMAGTLRSGERGAAGAGRHCHGSPRRRTHRFAGSRRQRLRTQLVGSDRTYDFPRCDAIDCGANRRRAAECRCAFVRRLFDR
jgi:iron(III) transport system ATP-binding protein